MPDPFLVLATQNPIETEGTYALPEAQVDRFMMKVLVGYPSPTEEFVIVERMTGLLPVVAAGAHDRRAARAAAGGRPGLRRPGAVSSTRSGWRRRRGRPRRIGLAELERYITFGASPRASINLILTARALAFVRGRDYVLPEDVTDMALDVLRHRIVLSFEALSDNVTSDDDPQRRSSTGSPSRSSRCESMATSTSAPERILQRLDWQVIRRLDGLLQGDYRSLFYGYGVDFADLREYQPGDDVRYIDWNVTARMDTPYVRQYLEDREITAWFLLDLSPSVDFGTVGQRAPEAGRPGRLRHHARAAADPPRQPGRGRSSTAARSGGRSPPRGGRIQVLRLVNDLLDQPRLPTRAGHRPDAAARGGAALDQGAARSCSSSPTSSARPAGSAR